MILVRRHRGGTERLLVGVRMPGVVLAEALVARLANLDFASTHAIAVVNRPWRRVNGGEPSLMRLSQIVE